MLGLTPTSCAVRVRSKPLLPEPSSPACPSCPTATQVGAGAVVPDGRRLIAAGTLRPEGAARIPRCDFPPAPHGLAITAVLKRLCWGAPLRGVQAVARWGLSGRGWRSLCPRLLPAP